MNSLRRLLLILSAPLVALVVVGTVGAKVRGGDPVLRDLKVFSEALQLVNLYYVEDVPFGQLERGAFQGLAESLDPWSSFYDPDRMAALEARDLTGSVGALLVKAPQHYVRVAAVVPGSPAEKAGVRQGEFLESLDGLETKDLTLLEAELMLRGPVGTTVTLGYFRSPDEEEGRRVELVRQDLEPLRVVREDLGEGVARLVVTDVRGGIARRVAEELASLKQGGIDNLVLDLRHNFGGDPAEALALADLFMEGPAFARRDREGERLFSADRPPEWTGALVALIGRGTIGEAELVAEALRARGAAALVGEPTFGKTGQQDLIRLPDGSGIHTTIAEYRRADGEPFGDDGVQPDEEVPAEPVAEAAGEDETELPSARPETEAAPVDEGGQGAAAGTGAEGERPDDPQLRRAIEILAGTAERKAA